MEIKITRDTTGTGSFYFQVKDGPEHIDCYEGEGETLGKAIHKVLHFIRSNASFYRNENQKPQQALK